MKFSHLTDTIILFSDEFDNFQTKLIRVGHNLHLKLGVQVLGCRSLEAQVPALGVGFSCDLPLADRHEHVGNHNQDDWL